MSAGTADEALAAARADLADALGLGEATASAEFGSALELALVHRSYSYENGGIATNERLEFLGDAVVGLSVTEALFRRYPDATEGQLSRMRAAVVSRPGLAAVGRVLGVGGAVRLGRGEEAQGGRDKDSILADTTEAVVGAVHLALGVDAARDLVQRLTAPYLALARDTAAGADAKTALQELAARRGEPAPAYEVEVLGPVHARSFVAEVALGGRVVGRGEGRSKKAAEQAAAARAVTELDAGAA